MGIPSIPPSSSFPTVRVLGHKYSGTQFDCFGATNGQNILLDSFIIPANTIGINGYLRISAMYTFPGTGANGKDPLIRIGLTSGNFSTATNIVNNQGFTTQKTYTPFIQMHNKGVQNSNIWTPPQSPGIGNLNNNAVLNSSIDFSQSVTIYFGGTCSNTYGTAEAYDIVRLETFEVEYMP